MVKKLLKNLGIWILIAMIIGAVVGSYMGPEAEMFKPLGDLFIQLIKMLVVPLVLVSIISGAAALGETKSAGLIGGVSIFYMLATTFIAIALAIGLGVIFEPGKNVDHSEVEALAIAATDGESSEQKSVPYEELIAEGGVSGATVEGVSGATIEGVSGATAEATTESVATAEAVSEDAPQPMGFWETVIGMIPENPVKALTDGNILQIIVFGMFVGLGLSTLAPDKRRKATNGLNIVLEALIWCIGKVMLVAPFGVFGLIADATGTFGFDMLLQVANVLWLDIIAVLIIGVGLYPMTIALFSRVSLKRYFKAMVKPQIVSFSTASSLATLPVNMEACNEMGVSKQVSGFVLPLGATINMAGNAIYYALLAIFFAQFYGIELAMGDYISIAIVCTLGAIGQAGVPGPTVLAAAVLVAAGIPLEGLPLFYALDRIFDMIRTTLNITGDAACAACVDRLVKR